MPQEWNVFCGMSAVFLFGPPSLDYGPATAAASAAASLPASVASLAAWAQTALPGAGAVGSLPWPTVAVLALTEGLIPLVGNIWPQRTSFLLSRRYYAGNWPGSVWLIKRSSWPKLLRVPTASGTIIDQLEAFYAEPQVN